MLGVPVCDNAVVSIYQIVGLLPRHAFLGLVDIGVLGDLGRVVGQDQ